MRDKENKNHKTDPHVYSLYSSQGATAYNTAYSKANYYRPSFVLPKEYKDILIERAKEHNTTISGYIRMLIDSDTIKERV